MKKILFIFLALFLVKGIVFSQDKICCFAKCQKEGLGEYFTTLNLTGFTNECRGRWVLKHKETQEIIKCELQNKVEPCNIESQNYIILGEDFSQGIVQCREDPCSIADLFYNIQRFLRFIVWFAFWFAVIISVTGSFLWMFGGPFPHLQSRGKSMIKTSIIGYILLLSIGIIFDIILEFLGPKFKWGP